MNIIASVITIPYRPFHLHIALRASEELRSRREGVVLDVSSTCVSSVTMLEGGVLVVAQTLGTMSNVEGNNLLAPKLFTSVVYP